MNLRFLLGVSIILFSCEQIYHNQLKITGTWKVSIEMYDEDVLINELNGEMVFYADNTASLRIDGDDINEKLNYSWHEQPDYLVLINLSSNFPLLYYIESKSNEYIELSQTENVKMKLLR